MKITKLIFAALLAVATVSCEKEPALNSNPEAAPESNKVPLILSTGEGTKTSLVGNDIHWSATDEIAVFDNSIAGDNKNKFIITAISEENPSSATFSGSVGATTSAIYAVYPYALATSCDFNTISSDKILVNLPNEQLAKVDSFDENINISIAKASDLLFADKNGLPKTNVTFRNVCAILKFSLPSTLPGNLNSVILSSNSAIAGEMSIDYSGNDPKASVSADGAKSIIMTGTFEAGKTYCFVLAPGLESNEYKIDGLSVSVQLEDGTIYGMSTSDQIVMTMGKYRSLGTLDFTKMSTFSYSAEHDFQNSVLQGTNVKVNFPSTDVSNVNITITKGDVKRNMTDANLTIENGKKVAVSGSNDAAWPYLPSGDYTISGSYTMAGEVITISPATLTVARPEGITITGFNAYTSYTKYSAGDVSGANALSGSSIYVQASNINVSEVIQEKYSNLLSLQYLCNGNSGSSVTGALSAEISAPVYGKYSDLKYCFDGVTGATITSTCHVTGLPYALNTAANDSVNPWQITQDAKWNNSDRADISVRVGYALGSSANVGASSISKSFYLPSDVNVSVSANAEARGSRFIINIETKGSVFISGEPACSASAKGKGKYVPFSCDGKEMVMSSSNPTVVCNNSNSTNEACTYFKSLVIYYL